MVDQRVCGSVHGGVEMMEEDSTAMKGKGWAVPCLEWAHPRIGQRKMSGFILMCWVTRGMLRGILILETMW
jgi:hypothetical protein